MLEHLDVDVDEPNTLAKGKPYFFNRPLQNVYPLEVPGISGESSRVWVGVDSAGSANEHPD